MKTIGQSLIKKITADTGQPDAPRDCRMPSVGALPSARLVLVPRRQLNDQAIRTIHYYLHAIEKAIDHIENLGNNHLRLLSGEPVKPLQHSFDVAFSKQSRCTFFCHVFSHESSSVREDLLSSPWVVCLVARARTDNSSAIILTTISAIAGVGSISV